MTNRLARLYGRYLAWSNSPHTHAFIREPAKHETLSRLMDAVGRKMGWSSWVR